MWMPAGSLGEPVADQFGLVAGRVVHDDVNVEFSGHILLDGVEELAKLLRAVSRHALADDGSGLYVQSGEQRRRPMSFVVVGMPFDLPRAHR